MKKLLFTIFASVVLLVGCYKDQNHNCACNGSYGTDFTGLMMDSLCSAWKSAMCPKSWTCSCTMNGPTIGIVNKDSIDAATQCTTYAQTLQKDDYQYNGIQCSL